MTQTINLHLLSEAVAPITHMARSEGNESLVAREPLMTSNGVRWLPFLSGNAIRHRVVREPGARWLVNRLGLNGKLSLEELNFLFHGGNLTQGGGREDTRLIADMQQLFPLIRLLGGAIPSQILAGSLQAWRGLLACAENANHLPTMLPDGFSLDDPLRPAEQFVSGYQYTRGDAVGAQRDLLPPVIDGVESDSNLMIFSGQAVTRGAIFLHGFTLQHSSEMELGALLLSLTLWQQGGGTIGGQAARGHGRLKTWILSEQNDHGNAIDAYIAHVDTNEDACKEWLLRAFKAKEEKPKKGKKEAATT